jgi:hypothetical protein
MPGERKENRDPKIDYVIAVTLAALEHRRLDRAGHRFPAISIKWFASAVSLVRYVRIVVCLRTAAWIGLFDTQDLAGLPLDREVLVRKRSVGRMGETDD